MAVLQHPAGIAMIDAGEASLFQLKYRRQEVTWNGNRRGARYTHTETQRRIGKP